MSGFACCNTLTPCLADALARVQKPVWILFAMRVGGDVLFTLYTVPSVAISRGDQRPKALESLQLPQTALADYVAAGGRLPTRNNMQEIDSPEAGASAGVSAARRPTVSRKRGRPASVRSSSSPSKTAKASSPSAVSQRPARRAKRVARGAYADSDDSDADEELANEMEAALSDSGEPRSRRSSAARRSSPSQHGSETASRAERGDPAASAARPAHAHMHVQPQAVALLGAIYAPQLSTAQAAPPPADDIARLAAAWAEEPTAHAFSAPAAPVAPRPPVPTLHTRPRAMAGHSSHAGTPPPASYSQDLEDLRALLHSPRRSPAPGSNPHYYGDGRGRHEPTGA